MLADGTTNNRIQSLPGVTPTYDSNGNLTSDGTHTASWDAEGNPVQIDATAETYDALGRMVEFGSANKAVVYSPTGGKLALMTGQTLTKAFVPLPGGATAVYTSAGIAYYRHADWLGSSRVASTPSRTKYYDAAYAPYGENYAGSGTTDLSFTGQNQDAVAGFYDFWFRKYNPVHGRWVSPDPAGISATASANPQTWNRYAYVLNNPLAMVDPLGLCVIDGMEYQDNDWACSWLGGGGGGGGGSAGGGGGSFVAVYVPGYYQMYGTNDDIYLEWVDPTWSYVYIPGNIGSPPGLQKSGDMVGGGGNPANNTPQNTQQQAHSCSQQASAAAAPYFNALKWPSANTITGGAVLGGVAKIATKSTPIGVVVSFLSIFRDDIGAAVNGTVVYVVTHEVCATVNGPAGPPASY